MNAKEKFNRIVRYLYAYDPDSTSYHQVLAGQINEPFRPQTKKVLWGQRALRVVACVAVIVALGVVVWLTINRGI